MSDIGGVWRTVGGRRIFIKDGEDLATAMKNSGKFSKKYKDKQEINKRIKEINKQIYSGDGVDKEEYDGLKKELDELKKLKKEFDDKIQSEQEKKIKKILDGDGEELKKELELELNDIEQYEDDYGIEESYLDDIQTESTKKIMEMYEDEQIDDLQYENFIDTFNNQINSIMYKKGYEVYEHRGKIYYSMIPKAKKAYNEILNELDKRNVEYEISRSWNPGELPSIYVEDKDGNQFRIANHFNSKNQQFEAFKENKIYSTKDYINYKETVLKDLDEFLSINKD